MSCCLLTFSTEVPCFAAHCGVYSLHDNLLYNCFISIFLLYISFIHQFISILCNSWFLQTYFAGDPAEVYSHGAVYVFIGLGYMSALPVFAHFFVPVYHSMKLTTAYEVKKHAHQNKSYKLFLLYENLTVLMFYRRQSREIPPYLFTYSHGFGFEFCILRLQIA